LIGQAWSIALTDACPPVGEVAMHWLRGGYVGLATVSAAECLIAAAIEKSPTRDGPSGRLSPWRSLRSANPDAAILELIEAPALGSKLGMAGFPHRPRRVGHGNLLFVGDAAGFEEPFSGEGIGQALRSGLAAADALLASGDEDAVLSQYRRGLRLHRRVRRRTRWMSHLLRLDAVFALAGSSLLPFDVIGRHLLRSVHVKAGGKGGTCRISYT
jgi:flavin-dependent dehydrogenase